MSNVILGARGATGPAGAPAITWKGAYSAGTTYATNDAVSYQGSSWLALQTALAQTPAEGAYWTCIAAKGATGAAGAKGDTGATGAAGPAGSAHVAETAPGVGDDSDDGFVIGSIWVDSIPTPPRAYIALNVTPGAATWKRITLT